MKYKFDRYFKTKINDQVWECYIVTKEEGIELKDDILEEEDEDFEGMVSFPDKCIFIGEESVDKETITHELFHVTVDSFHISSASLDVDQFEEIMAVWAEYDLDKFIKTRNKLFKKFKNLKEKYNGNKN